MMFSRAVGGVWRCSWALGTSTLGVRHAGAVCSNLQGDAWTLNKNISCRDKNISWRDIFVSNPLCLGSADHIYIYIYISLSDLRWDHISMDHPKNVVIFFIQTVPPTIFCPHGYIARSPIKVVLRSKRRSTAVQNFCPIQNSLRSEEVMST